MKKFMYLATAVAAIAFASCTSDDAISSAPQVAENDGAVNFGVYTAGKSRATNVDSTTVWKGGFGVFAYSTDQKYIKDYLVSDYTPNFMYNQKVTKDTIKNVWEYAPVKYWPNNPGAMVSYYAYAPYESALTDDNYTQTPDNNNYLNNVKYVDGKNIRLQLGKDYFGPGIEYVVPADPTQGVDLLWGQEKESNVAPVNKTKQAIDEKIEFVFKHALSRLHFNIQVWPDEVSKDCSDDEVSEAKDSIADGTTITIDKVELVGKIAKGGTLRLYDGTWNVESGDYEDIVFEGDMLNSKCRWGLTNKDAQKEIDLLKGTSMKDGVQLPDSVIDNFVMLIPNTTFFIRLTYTVTTKDPNNSKNNSTVTNVIKSTDSNVKIGTLGDLDAAMDQKGYVTLKAGQAYDFHLNIGLTSVKFDATVEDWNFSGNEIDMPKNTETAAEPAPEP